MDDGQLVEDGPPDQLADDPSSYFAGLIAHMDTGTFDSTAAADVIEGAGEPKESIA